MTNELQQDTSTFPSILETNPKPVSTLKSFHGRKIQIWDGVAKISKISGWVGNPRLDLELKRFRDSNAGRSPNDDEILNIMTSVKEFDIKTLADDIRDNGVRQPVIVSNDGRLLDGNRRYFASRYLISKTPENDPNLSDYQKIPVWVLQQSNQDDEHRILVQENFYSSLKVEWGDYVKATYVYNDLNDGLSVIAVKQKYGWPSAKVNETKKIMGLIDEFKNFATTDEGEDGLGLEELEAERIAAEKYQFFNEAQKSFYGALEKDYEFKKQFFRWLCEGTFASFQEVRIAHEAWSDDRAKKELMSGDTGSAKKAKAILDYKRLMHDRTEKAEDNIEDFIKFLEGLTAHQITSLPADSIEKLEGCLKRVTEMAKAAKKA